MHSAQHIPIRTRSGNLRFWAAQLLYRAATAARRLWVTHRNRRDMHLLLQKDDRMLADIGIGRAEIESAVSAPWYQDPVERLVRGRQPVCYWRRGVGRG